MDYRSLGRTGVMVSELCLGCMNFGGVTSDADGMDVIDRAIEEGINFLDTANVYSRGGSEIAVGKALKRNGKRDSIVLATKVHGRMDDDDILAAGNNRRHIVQQCEASLKRLQTDYIDLYQIHRPNSNIPDRRDIACARRSDSRGQSSLYRRQYFPGMAHSGVFLGGERIGTQSLCQRAAPLSSAGPQHRTGDDTHGAELWHGHFALVAACSRFSQRQIQTRGANPGRQPLRQ